jgi:hypothetical protein
MNDLKNQFLGFIQQSNNYDLVTKRLIQNKIKSNKKKKHLKKQK